MKCFKLCLVIAALMSGVSYGAMGLVHHYNFEDGTANDSIGGLDGTLVGNAYIAGGDLVLDGVDDWMELDGAALALNTYSEFSMEAWYVAGNNPGWSMIASFGNTQSGWMGVDYFFMTSHRDDNKSRAAISCGDYGAPWGDESGADGPEYNDSLLHHMVATVDATTISLYIDGVLTGTSLLGDDDLIANISTVYAYIGKAVYGDPEWAGAIDEFNIYNQALPACVVEYMYQAGPYIPEPATMILLGLGSLVLVRRRK